jgi:hypothetical protein
VEPVKNPALDAGDPPGVKESHALEFSDTDVAAAELWLDRTFAEPYDAMLADANEIKQREYIAGAQKKLSEFHGRTIAWVFTVDAVEDFDRAFRDREPVVKLSHESRVSRNKRRDLVVIKGGDMLAHLGILDYVFVKDVPFAAELKKGDRLRVRATVKNISWGRGDFWVDLADVKVSRVP